jgi:hypothetical protein
MEDVGLFYGRLVYFTAILVYFVAIYFIVIWFIFPFWYVVPKKSGNSARGGSLTGAPAAVAPLSRRQLPQLHAWRTGTVSKLPCFPWIEASGSGPRSPGRRLPESILQIGRNLRTKHYRGHKAIFKCVYTIHIYESV